MPGSGVLWLIESGVLWLIESGVLWLIESGVLWLIEAVVVGLGLLSRKYCFLVAGVVKEQNGQGEHQFERLKFLDGPKGTI